MGLAVKMGVGMEVWPKSCPEDEADGGGGRGRLGSTSTSPGVVAGH